MCMFCVRMFRQACAARRLKRTTHGARLGFRSACKCRRAGGRGVGSREPIAAGATATDKTSSKSHLAADIAVETVGTAAKAPGFSLPIPLPPLVVPLPSPSFDYANQGS